MCIYTCIILYTYIYTNRSIYLVCLPIIEFWNIFLLSSEAANALSPFCSSSLILELLLCDNADALNCFCLWKLQNKIHINKWRMWHVYGIYILCGLPSAPVSQQTSKKKKVLNKNNFYVQPHKLRADVWFRGRLPRDVWDIQIYAYTAAYIRLFIWKVLYPGNQQELTHSINRL